MNNTIEKAYTIPNNIFKVAGSEKQKKENKTAYTILKATQAIMLI